MTKTTQKTQTIAGHELTLLAGQHYIATRPMASRRNQRFTVSIRKTGSDYINGSAVTTVSRLTYDAANELINTFNNKLSSWDGRTW